MGDGGLDKKVLEKLYLEERKSTSEISEVLHCSDRKVDYWLHKYKIPKRSISEAIYAKCNPTGDPFTIHNIDTRSKEFLLGLGLGLYWGEGTKSNKNTVRLGNTDPELILKFIEFLEKIYEIDKNKLRFGLQVFSDMPATRAKNFWVKKLRVPPMQFYKVIVTPARSIGTYRRKTKYGVVTVYFGNKKLRDIICNEIEKL